MQYDIKRDLVEAQAMVAALTPYIYEDRLYGKIGGLGFARNIIMPSLTPGAVLLRLRRLNALQAQLDDVERALLAEIDSRNEEIFGEWRMHYEKKLLSEAASRLRQIGSFFNDCREDPELCANAYLPEANRRTIVHEISAFLEKRGVFSAELDSKAEHVDSRLRDLIHAGDFVWPGALQAVYPQLDYWWLYGRPKG